MHDFILVLSLNYANRIKIKECMFTKDCFTEFLQALAETLIQYPEYVGELQTIEQIKRMAFPKIYQTPGGKQWQG